MLNEHLKVSGTASKLGNKIAYHHGSLLINVDSLQLHPTLRALDVSIINMFDIFFISFSGEARFRGVWTLFIEQTKACEQSQRPFAFLWLSASSPLLSVVLCIQCHYRLLSNENTRHLNGAFPTNTAVFFFIISQFSWWSRYPPSATPSPSDRSPVDFSPCLSSASFAVEVLFIKDNPLFSANFKKINKKLKKKSFKYYKLK